jgi:hypothetical protein
VSAELKAQQLHAVNISVNIGEAMEARTKDGLWFLVRQLSLGEFFGKNGGRPASLHLSWREHPLVAATVGNAKVNVDRRYPLEPQLEAEDGNRDAPAWRSAALEYGFSVHTDMHGFVAEEYHGRGLDWYHFDHAGPAQPSRSEPPLHALRIAPTQLFVRGAPHPRWWRFEDSDAYFDTPEDPEPNALSTLLPELFFVDVNNWYVAPFPSESGVLREIVRVTLVDTFDVATNIDPVFGNGGQEDWRIFAASGREAVAALDGRFLLMPNVALEILENDDIEDVRWIRDEEGYLVWAWEHRYVGADGVPVVQGDRRRLQQGQPQSPAKAGNQLPPFRFRTEAEQEWIPYVPRYLHPNTAVAGGDMYLRRGRTMENASRASPQYSSKIVAESWKVNEEEIPPTGVRVRRVMRYAQGSDGSHHHWIGREREIGRRLTHPDLRFDYVDEPGAG